MRKAADVASPRWAGGDGFGVVQGQFAGLGYPAEVDEGTITALVKERNPFKRLFGGEEELESLERQ